MYCDLYILMKMMCQVLLQGSVKMIENTDSEDVRNFFKLLDKPKIELPLFVALNACPLPRTDPANVD